MQSLFDMNNYMHNESTLDRVLRIALGLAVLSLLFIGPKSAWGLLGIIPLATGIVGYCPLYAALGLSTCNLRRAHS
ncbi:MAG TPA: DUF2892 domain-containing protein [Kofleriaceae bacterium]|nr:DUF2892 domain-containing protein [Kofleriaceae bacterium]